MKKGSTIISDKLNIKRLASLLTAVVFVLGTALIPADIYGVEPAVDVTQEQVSSETELQAEEPQTEELTDQQAEEETVEVEADVEAAEEVSVETVEEPEEPANDLSDALTVDPETLDDIEYDGFIYKLEDDATKSEINEMENAIEELEEVPDQDVSEVIHEELYTADSVETIEEVAAPDMVEYIEPNYMVKALGVPNDPAYSTYSWQLEMTNIPYVWDKGMTGYGATVAVLDSGVNTSHPDLKGVTFVNKYNVYTGTSSVTDNLSHGTAVAGVIAETRNNGIGFAGAMPKTKIMPIKVLDDNGYSYISKVVKGIDYAISKKADVINMSFGGTFSGTSSIALENACKKAVNAGAILVSASGNEGDEGNEINYPASYDCVVSVGAVTKSRARASFSNYNNKLTVVAPGSRICLLSSSGGYATSSGTSFATPQVSALAAMVKSGDKSFNQTRFTELLKNTSQDLGTAGYDNEYGYGLIDFGKVYDTLSTKISSYTISLSASQYTYSGGVKTPSVSLAMGSKKLVRNTDYKVTYSSGRKSVGTYKVTVTGINGYTSSKSTTFRIVPPLVKSIKAPQRYVKKLKVRWKSMSKSQKKKYKSAITGYQVRVSTNSKFTGAKYKKVKGYKKTSVTVKGLKKKKTYYVQYRAYKTVGSTTYYSKWSKTKKAKTK